MSQISIIPKEAPSTFDKIIRASLLLASSSAFTVLISLIRSKCVAILLGPSGIGMLGLLISFNGSFSTLCGWGLNTSGVRTISSGGADERESRESAVRFLGLRLALCGLFLSLLSAPVVCFMTFDSWNNLHILIISALSVPALIIAGGWVVILQSSGKLKSLAINAVFGSLAGLVIGVPFIFFFGLTGVAVSLLAAAFATAVASYWALRHHHPTSVTVLPSKVATKEMLRMGGTLMLVGLFSQLAGYLVRLSIVKYLGLDAAGQYTAAFAFSGSLTSFVFIAMATDFYPRVAAASNDFSAARIVEAQVVVGLLLGVPALSLLLAMGSFFIHLFFSGEFEAAVSLMNWMIWGVFLRLVSWPYGYYLMAKGSSRMILAVEGLASLILGIFPFILIPLLGLNGSGLAYVLSYLIHLVIVISSLWKRSGRFPSSLVFVSVSIAAILLGICHLITIPLSKTPLLAAIPVVIVTLSCGIAYLYIKRRLMHLF